ncbi:hypothetical protein PENTCL1PPCAC_267, partial [Pristionchus entomophagus]
FSTLRARKSNKDDLHQLAACRRAGDAHQRAETVVARAQAPAAQQHLQCGETRSPTGTRLPRAVYCVHRPALPAESPVHPRPCPRALLHPRCDQEEETDRRVDGDLPGDPGHLHQGRRHHHLSVRLRRIPDQRAEEEGRHCPAPQEHLHHCRADVRGPGSGGRHLPQVASRRVPRRSRTDCGSQSEEKGKPSDEHNSVVLKIDR